MAEAKEERSSDYYQGMIFGAAISAGVCMICLVAVVAMVDFGLLSWCGV